MDGRQIRVIRAGGAPEAVGRAHGSFDPAAMRRYAEDRIALSAAGTTLSRDDIVALGARLLPSHERYAPDLFSEMVAMAESADLTPAEALIVGGYTDFIDTVRAHAGGTAVEDACTAVLVPDGLAGGAGFLAQTWDMHASATQHIVLLDLSLDGGPRAMVFTTLGALGQIGLNDAGIAIGINNLTAADGRIGVTWPFVVRKALQQTTIDAALACVTDAPLAGGHNFLLLDGDGNGYSIEAMPTATHVDKLGGDLLGHTNHCLAPATVAVEGDRPEALQLSSSTRLTHVPELLRDRPVTVEALMALTRDERAICRHPEPPFDYESCGAMIMRPATREFWAVWGIPSGNEYEHFTLT